MGFNVNWFLGALAFELWLAPYVLMFWPEISEAWRQWRADRALDRLAARHPLHARPRPNRLPAPARIS